MFLSEEITEHTSEQTQASYIVSCHINKHNTASGILSSILDEANDAHDFEISNELFDIVTDMIYVIDNHEGDFLTIVEDKFGNFTVYIPSGEDSFSRDYVDLLFDEDCLFYSYEIGA